MTPSYRIVVNGQNITPKLNGRLINLTLTDERGDTADQLDITLDDSDGQLAIPPRNASIEVWIGWTGELVYKGAFTLDEIIHQGPPDTLVLRARSVDFKGSLKRKREQSYHGITLGDILTTIAKRNDLTPMIDTALAATAIEHLDQTSESDISLVRRLAEQYGAVGTVKAARLLFSPAGTGTTPSGTELPTITLYRRGGDQHSYQLTDRDHDYTGVQAHWHNTDTGEQQTITIGSADTPKVLRHTYPTEAEAADAAKGEYRRMMRGGATLALLLAEGRADLYPETPVRASGFKSDVDATDWITVRVVHSLGDSGYTTRVEMEARQ